MPMIKNTNDMSLTLSLNILKALGGDTSVQYETVDDVWVAINEIYGRAGDGIDIESIILDITENGQYNFDPNDEVDAFAPVHLNVNVPQKYTDEQVTNLQNTARQEGYQEGFVDGESEGEINQKAKLIDIEITDNGVYETENCYKKVTVTVEQGIPDDELQQMLQEAMDEGYQDGYAEGVDDGYEDGAAEQKEKLTSVTFKDNGTYTREDGWNEVTVEVEIPDIPTFETETLSVNLTDNGTYNYTPTTDGYSSVSVNVKVESTGTGKPKVYNGFRFTTGYPLQVDFSQYDWSNVYDLTYMFAGCRRDNSDNWTNFQNNFNGRILSLAGAFKKEGSYCMSSLPSLGSKTANCYNMRSMCEDNNNLTHISINTWDTNNVIDMSSMFKNCSKITYVSIGDINNVTDTSNMFYGCSALTTVNIGSTNNIGDASNMFYGCHSLTSIPQLDTSKVVNTSSMFNSCRSLTSIPQLDTSSASVMAYMFQNCAVLTSIPQLDTSSATNLGGMFSGCSALTTIPQLDTSNVTNVNDMFSGCSALTELPDLNLSKLTSFGSSYSSWLRGTSKLAKIGVIDCDSITNASYAMGESTNNNLTDISGFRNLGKASSVSNTNGNYFMTYAPNLTHQSLLNVFNLLYDRASAGLSILTIKMHANHLALLSDEDIAIATNKGWTIA